MGWGRTLSYWIFIFYYFFGWMGGFFSSLIGNGVAGEIPAAASTALRGERNHALDVLKCVAAFMVLLIHCSNHFFSPLSRLGVPIFFLITGFYYPALARNGRIKGQVIKLLKILLVMLCVVLAYDILAHFLFDDGRLFAEQPKIAKHGWTLYILRVLGLGTVPLPTGYHLWYLHAAALGIVCLALIDRFRLRRPAIYLAGVLLLLLVVANYNQRIGYDLSQNWILFGLPFLIIGKELSELYSRGYRVAISNKIISAILAVLALLLAGEGMMRYLYTGSMNTEMYLFGVPTTILLFLLALNNPGVGAGTVWAAIGRKYSLYIYLLHPIFLDFNKMPRDIGYTVFALPVSVGAVTLMAAVFCRWVGKRFGK